MGLGFDAFSLHAWQEHLIAWGIVVLFFVAQAVCLYATSSRRPDIILVSKVLPLTPLLLSSSYGYANSAMLLDP